MIYNNILYNSNRWYIATIFRKQLKDNWWFPFFCYSKIYLHLMWAHMYRYVCIYMSIKDIRFAYRNQGFRPKKHFITQSVWSLCVKMETTIWVVHPGLDCTHKSCPLSSLILHTALYHNPTKTSHMERGNEPDTFNDLQLSNWFW